MAIAFLANGHVQVTALKKGTGDRFFSTSKWQKRYLDVDPESGVLEYSDKPGGAPRGTFTVRNAIVTLPSASEEAAHMVVLVRPDSGALLRLQMSNHMERGALALLLMSVSAGADFGSFMGLFNDLSMEGCPPSPVRNGSAKFPPIDDDAASVSDDTAPPPLPRDPSNILALQLHVMQCSALALRQSLNCSVLTPPTSVSDDVLDSVRTFDGTWNEVKTQLNVRCEESMEDYVKIMPHCVLPAVAPVPVVETSASQPVFPVTRPTAPLASASTQTDVVPSRRTSTDFRSSFVAPTPARAATRDSVSQTVSVSRVEIDVQTDPVAAEVMLDPVATLAADIDAAIDAVIAVEEDKPEPTAPTPAVVAVRPKPTLQASKSTLSPSSLTKPLSAPPVSATTKSATVATGSAVASLITPVSKVAVPAVTRPHSTSFISPFDMSEVGRSPASLSPRPGLSPISQRAAITSLPAKSVSPGGKAIVPPAPPKSSPLSPLSASSLVASPSGDDLPTTPLTPVAVFAAKKGYGVAVSQRHHKLYTTSFNAHCIEVFSLDSPSVVENTVGRFGSSDGQFKDVCKCVVVPSRTGETLLVVDADNSRVQEFEADGTFKRCIGVGVLTKPHGVASDGKIVAVTETHWKSHRVTVFDYRSGDMVRQFGSRGNGPDQFDSPCGIAIDASGGLLYIADSANVRVGVFTTAGVHVRTLGTDLRLKWPTDVCLLPCGDVAIADTRNHRIIVVDAADGRVKSCFGREGVDPGQMKAPVALAATPSGALFVMDSLHDRCQLFQL